LLELLLHEEVPLHFSLQEFQKSDIVGIYHKLSQRPHNKFLVLAAVYEVGEEAENSAT
jgi:hypothetical protein